MRPRRTAKSDMVSDLSESRSGHGARQDIRGWSAFVMPAAPAGRGWNRQSPLRHDLLTFLTSSTLDYTMLSLTSRAARSLRTQAVSATRAFSASTVQRDEKLNDLLSKFSDPKSPYYLAKGEVGPASPDDTTTARPLPGQENVNYERPR